MPRRQKRRGCSDAALFFGGPKIVAAVDAEFVDDRTGQLMDRNGWRLGCAALISLALVLGARQGAHAAETIRVVTEEWPPYNMLRDGHVIGMGTDVVEAVMKQVGVTAPIELMPWARAYETALTEPNVIIYSMARTPAREKLFKWVGAVGQPDHNYLYALASRHLHLKDLEEARGYRIATINDDFGEKYLLARGFVLGKNLSRSNKFESSYEKLKLGRVDLWLTGELSASYIARKAGDDPALLLVQALFVPNVSGDDNDAAAMAFSPQTSDALVERFRQGWRTIRDNGTFDAIQQKWR